MLCLVQKTVITPSGKQLCQHHHIVNMIDIVRSKYDQLESFFTIRSDHF